MWTFATRRCFSCRLSDHSWSRTAQRFFNTESGSDRSWRCLVLPSVHQVDPVLRQSTESHFDDKCNFRKKQAFTTPRWELLRKKTRAVSDPRYYPQGDSKPCPIQRKALAILNLRDVPVGPPSWRRRTRSWSVQPRNLPWTEATIGIVRSCLRDFPWTESPRTFGAHENRASLGISADFERAMHDKPSKPDKTEVPRTST